MTNSFETLTTGKWILAGEHTVLRGGKALVFPLPAAQLTFSFIPSDQRLRLIPSGTTGNDFDLLFWSVFEKACSLTNTDRESVRGQISLASEIPVGAGLGASAAFCVAFARWFAKGKIIPTENIEGFARELENLFHGESSGVDIAVAHSGMPLKFTRNGQREILKTNWKPELYLSYTGQRGVTRECVAKVKDLLTENPAAGNDIDQMMMKSVELAESALEKDRSQGLSELAKALRLSAECFSAWGLFDGAPEKQANLLLKAGALAVKPTGSGGGGYLLSLWPERPNSLKIPNLGPLIPCY